MLYSIKKFGILSHLAYTIFVMLALCMSDFVLSKFINISYVFRFTHLKILDVLVVFFFLLIMSLMGKWCRRTMLFLVFIITSTQWLSFQYFGTYIQPIQIVQLLPDFTLISRSFFEVLPEMYSVFCLIAFLAMTLITLELFYWKNLKTKPWYASFILVYILIHALWVYGVLNRPHGKVYHVKLTVTLPAYDRLAIDNFYRSLTYLTYGILPKKLVGGYQEAPSLEAPLIASKAPDINIFFILNETVRSRSMSLLGFKEYQTTPLMENIEGLYSKSIYSASVMTRTSFAGIMHRMKYPWMGKQYSSKSNCLYKLAKENGFKTHFLYSYERFSAETLLPYMCADSIDEVRTRNDYPKSLHGYDRNLFKAVEELNFDDNNFVVIGLQGAHTPYKINAPQEFVKTGSDYLNSILYSDYSMDRLIKIIKKKSTKPTVIISTSDHGELLPEEGELRGHGWLKKDVYEVPFIYLPVNMDREILQTDVENVRSHFDVSTLVLKALGYNVSVEENTEKRVYINGSDLNGLAGRVEILIKNDEVVSVSNKSPNHQVRCRDSLLGCRASLTKRVVREDRDDYL